MNDTADRIRSAATKLFADRGYDGTSVRAICSAAGTNVNAVSYHFGGKQQLYAAVIQGHGDERLAGAKRMLGAAPKDQRELDMRLLMFAEETLAAWLAEPELLIILFAEFQQGFRNAGQETMAGLVAQRNVLVAFLRGAAEAGLLRDGVDVDLVAGGLIERLNNQVLYEQTIKTLYGVSIQEPEYRSRWTRQIISLALYGAARPGAPS